MGRIRSDKYGDLMVMIGSIGHHTCQCWGGPRSWIPKGPRNLYFTRGGIQMIFRMLTNRRICWNGALIGKIEERGIWLLGLITRFPRLKIAPGVWGSADYLFDVRLQPNSKNLDSGTIRMYSTLLKGPAIQRFFVKRVKRNKTPLEFKKVVRKKGFSI